MHVIVPYEKQHKGKKNKNQEKKGKKKHTNAQLVPTHI